MFIVVDGGVFDNFIYSNQKYLQMWLYMLANERDRIVELNCEYNSIMSRQQTRTFICKLKDSGLVDVLPSSRGRGAKTRLRLLDSSLFGSKYAKPKTRQKADDTTLQPTAASRQDLLDKFSKNTSK